MIKTLIKALLIMSNYKGIYFNQSAEQKIFEGGAHFSYQLLYERLMQLSLMSCYENSSEAGIMISSSNNNDNTITQTQSRNKFAFIKNSTQKHYIPKLNQYLYNSKDISNIMKLSEEDQDGRCCDSGLFLKTNMIQNNHYKNNHHHWH